MRQSFLFICSMFILTQFGCGSSTNDDDYRQLIDKHRLERDEYMKTSEASPFKDITYNKLSYFDADQTYKVQAKLEKAEKLDYIEIPTSTGKTNRYVKYGWAEFTLKGIDCKLMLMKPVGIGSKTDMVFLAFSDLTNGEETYGGGRYLDLTHRNATKIEIDFNKAYNPYCEYSPNFSCPIPPKENKLNLRIEAGEKRYQDTGN